MHPKRMSNKKEENQKANAERKYKRTKKTKQKQKGTIITKQKL